MTKKKYFLYEEQVNYNNEEITVNRIVNDTNGNPRYVISYYLLGLTENEFDNANKLFGFSEYRADWFGGGLVFQSYNIEEDLKYVSEKIDKVRNDKA